MQRTAAFSLGLLIAIAAVAVADSVLPSRPRFASVGVGMPAPAGNGNIAVTNTISGANINASTSFASIQYQVDNGGVDGFVQADGTGVSIGTLSDHPVSFYSNNVIGARLARPADGGRLDALNGFSQNGVPLPRICGLDAVVSASPSITNAWGCSPSIARNSVGNFTVTHNFALANQYMTLCTQRGSTSGTPGSVSIQSQSSNSMILRTYDNAGALSDSLTAIQCAVIRFLF